MTISRFVITQMDCPAEEQLVRLALGDLEGIGRVEFDLTHRSVTIEHRIDAGVVAAALEHLDLGASHLGDDGEFESATDPQRERSALWFALIVNAGFFVGELTVGVVSGSMGLIADALDMGADAGVYALSLAAVGTTAVRKKQLARASGYVQLSLAVIGLVEVTRRFAVDTGLPDPTSMIVLSALALAGNVATLAVLHRVRSGDAHLQASWIFTANDIKVNLLVIAAAVSVATFDSKIPDLLAGAVIFGVVANGARRILRISR